MLATSCAKENGLRCRDFYMPQLTQIHKQHRLAPTAVFILFGIFVLDTSVSSSYAGNASSPPLVCIGAFEKLALERSLGVEWEVKRIGETDEPSPKDRMIVRGFSPGLEEFNVSSEILANSNFPTLFSFYGKGASGSFREHFIPDAIAQHSDWKLVRDDRAIELEKVDGGVVVKNFTSLREHSLARLLDRTLSVRGRNRQNLVLKKSTAGWGGPSELDRQIPDLVAEEWRGDNTFVGFEFPMQGGVKSWGQIADWYKNLWWRLGLISDKNSVLIDSYVSSERDHIHWRTDPMQLPADQRSKTYSGLVGFWGDRNDAAFVGGFNVFHDKVSADGIVSLTRHDVRLVGVIDEMSYNYSLCPLTRSLYGRVTVGPDGIQIADRLKDLDPEVDHLVPPAFKRLLMGLRGGVDVTLAKGDQPIKVVELEARSTGDSTRGNLESLPSLIPGTNFVDVHELQSHASSTPRGLLDAIQELETRAKELGIPSTLVSEANREIDKRNQRRNEEYSRYIWRNNQILATYFIPLNDWLSHPIVQKNLAAAQQKGQREAAIQRYQRALERYKERMSCLDQARRDKTAEYVPDWLFGPPKFADGSNRFFPQGRMNGKDPSIYDLPRSERELSQYSDIFLYPTDPLILSALEIEMFRFVSESGLADLLKF